MPTLSAKARPIPRQRKFDHGIALELACQGWRVSEIAKRCKVAESSVQQALAKYSNILNDLQPGTIEAYRARRSDLLTLVESKLMASLADNEALAKSSINNRAYAFTAVHTARRLEEEKSTANSSSVLHVLIEQQHSQLFSKSKHSSTPHVQATGPSEPSVDTHSSTIE